MLCVGTFNFRHLKLQTFLGKNRKVCYGENYRDMTRGFDFPGYAVTAAGKSAPSRAALKNCVPNVSIGFMSKVRMLSASKVTLAMVFLG